MCILIFKCEKKVFFLFHFHNHFFFEKKAKAPKKIIKKLKFLILLIETIGLRLE
jgi:hypothetical protein